MPSSALLRGRPASCARAGLLGLSLLAVEAGCQPKIGDRCSTSIDCSQTGNRLCDSSQPDGYCTIFNCEPDKCPDNSVCVGFGNKIDPTCGDTFDPRWSRFERTFCMKACETTADCRSDLGYLCLAPSERRSTSIDILSDWKDFKVCFAPSNEDAPIASFEPPPVCFDTTVAASSGSGAGTTTATGSGTGGAGGGGGAGGSSGTSSASVSGSTTSVSSSSAGGAGGTGGS